MKVADGKFTAVAGTPYKVRLVTTDVTKHCFTCGKKTTRVIEARNVTKCEKQVEVPLCEQCQVLATLRQKLFNAIHS